MHTYAAGIDFNEPIPSTVSLTNSTPPSGVCTVINIIQDNLEEGVETFNVTITSPFSSQAVVVDGRGSAQVLIVELCEALSPPDNGNVDDATRAIGTVATYSCEEEFVLSDDSQRSCQANGTWSGEAPICLLGNKFKYYLHCQ